jgi:hypothetical protein
MAMMFGMVLVMVGGTGDDGAGRNGVMMIWWYDNDGDYDNGDGGSNGNDYDMWS